MSREQITVQIRNKIGRDNKALRQGGFLPGNIHGPNTESVTVQIGMGDFAKLYSVTGDTDLIDIQVEGESGPRPSLVSEVQTDPVSGDLIHVDFFQVDLNEKVEVEVPIEFIGESSAVKNKNGILLTVYDHFPISVLPTEIPHSIEIDISALENIGDSIMIHQVMLPNGVELMVEDKDDVVVKIEEERQLLEEEVAAAVEPVVESEGKEAEMVEKE